MGDNWLRGQLRERAVTGIFSTHTHTHTLKTRNGLYNQQGECQKQENSVNAGRPMCV